MNYTPTMTRLEKIEQRLTRITTRAFIAGAIIGALLGFALGFAVGYGQVGTTLVVPLTRGIDV